MRREWGEPRASVSELARDRRRVFVIAIVSNLLLWAGLISVWRAWFG